MSAQVDLDQIRADLPRLSREDLEAQVRACLVHIRDLRHQAGVSWPDVTVVELLPGSCHGDS